MQLGSLRLKRPPDVSSCLPRFGLGKRCFVVCERRLRVCPKTPPTFSKKVGQRLYSSLRYRCRKLVKSQFVYSILYKPCIFKAYRLLNVQTLCIFPCFCPYEPKQGKFLFSADYLIQQSCGSMLRFPCSVSVNVHCGTNISVSEKFLHIFRCCTV